MNKKNYIPDYNALFWDKVDKSLGNTKCWEWKVSLVRGYGRFWGSGKYPEPAHRFSFRLMYGDIHKNLDLDHLCLNRKCVNPLHLQPVTKSENGRRSHLQRPFKIECKMGHKFNKENTYWYTIKGRVSPRRYCKVCRNVNVKKTPSYLKRVGKFDGKSI